MPFKNSVLAAVVVVGVMAGRRVIVDAIGQLGASLQFWLGDDPDWTEAETNVAQVRLYQASGQSERTLNVNGPDADIDPVSGALIEGAAVRLSGDAGGARPRSAFVGVLEQSVAQRGGLQTLVDSVALGVWPVTAPPSGLGLDINAVGAVTSKQTGLRFATASGSAPANGAPVNLHYIRISGTASGTGTFTQSIPAGVFTAAPVPVIGAISSNTVNAWVSAVSATSITISGLAAGAAFALGCILAGG